MFLIPQSFIWHNESQTQSGLKCSGEPLQAWCSVSQQVAFRPRPSLARSPKKPRRYSPAYKSLGFQSGARVNWVVYDLETFPSSGLEGLHQVPCLWWNSPDPAKCHFWGLFVASRNTSKTTSYHWTSGDQWGLRPSPSTHTPLDPLFRPTLNTSWDPRRRAFPFSALPASLYTFCRCQPPRRPSHFPSFPSRPSIHPCTVSALHQSCPAQLSHSEWQWCPPGTHCFINMADRWGPAVWPFWQQITYAVRKIIYCPAAGAECNALWLWGNGNHGLNQHGIRWWRFLSSGMEAVSVREHGAMAGAELLFQNVK